MKALMFNGKLHFPDTPRMRNEIIPELLAFDPKVDRGGDDFLDACFSGETLVLTEHGWTRIDHIMKGDRVITRIGLRDVTKAWCKGYRNTKEYAGVRATPEHLCYTVNKGWVPIDALANGDTVVGCEMLQKSKPSFSTVASIVDTPTQSSLATEDISAPPVGAKPRDCYTETYGSTRTDLFRQDTTFTTLTKIPATTSLLISAASPQPSISASTPPQLANAVVLPNTWNTLPIFADLQKHGTHLKKGGSGTALTLKKTAKPCAIASIVEYPWSCGLPLRDAPPVAVKNETGNPQNADVKNVPVYDLNVSEQHEFFVLTNNGPLLVHNCVNGCLLIESIGRPLPPVPPTPKWRVDPGAVYGADIFKKKKGGSATIPGLRSNKW
jgi:hypothetical protein